MIKHPEAFLHSSATDKWKLEFGEKLYGREREIEALLDAARHVTTSYDDPIFDSVFLKRQEVIMVSGFKMVIEFVRVKWSEVPDIQSKKLRKDPR